MNIVVVGGAGFVGSNVIKQLLLKDSLTNIISLDNYTSGNVENHIENVVYIHGNSWDIHNIKELQDFDPDVVYHFGEFSRIVLSFEKTNDTFWSNTIGTQQILDYCVTKKSKLIYSGSTAIFGNDMKDQHLNPYAWTKSKNIELIHNYKSWFGLDFSICYFFNVFGPGQITKGAYATVVGIFENQFKEGIPLTVVSPGTQTRAFTHIDDIVAGILLMAEKGDGDGYFLGTTENISITDVAKMYKCDWEYIPSRKGERTSSTILKSRARDELGWFPKLDIRDYILDFISTQSPPQTR